MVTLSNGNVVRLEDYRDALCGTSRSLEERRYRAADRANYVAYLEQADHQYEINDDLYMSAKGTFA
jgi:hypothetical protein